MTIYDMSVVLSKEHLMVLGFSQSDANKLLNRTDMPVIQIEQQRYMYRDFFTDALEKCAKEHIALMTQVVQTAQPTDVQAQPR